METENFNPDCRQFCPRFQEAKMRDTRKNSLTLSGFMMNPSLGISAGELNHLEEQVVGKATVGCAGPTREVVPNESALHKLLGTGPTEVEIYTCQAPDTK